MAKVAAKPLESANLRLGTIMASLKVVKATNGSRSQVELRTTDGAQELFDTAVVTTPLGWLKHHKDAIQPLSDRISRAIDSLSFGNLEKVLIEFPSAFWDSHLGESADETASFVHWLSPKYASESNPHAWRLECVSFNAFPPLYRRSILLFYTFGDCSRHLTSLIHGKETLHRFELLREFFQPYYSRLPSYDPTTCAPLRFLATEWSQDEFSGFGSYCNFQVGVKDAAGDVKALRHGMLQHSIYFAGEHTAPFDGLGTVAGAYTSGEKVAYRILESLSSSG
ncbi:hypothetical protein MMC10_011001 [Thelotrema lepadinum]|nr:hypothetical protein [Thelotrema lepadinum]